MNEAIKLAIEKGGYLDVMKHHRVLEWDVAMKCILDPLFWQALGKALGWEKHDEEQKDLYILTGGNPDYTPRGLFKWHRNAHRYLDIKLTGGDEEKFWKELLK